jgi:PAS domain S-box-containing protein
MTMDELAMLLRAREEELSSIYENVPGIVFHVGVESDGDFRFLSVSRDFLVATGLTRQQVVGCLVREVIPPPSRGMVLNHYREAIRSGQPVRWEEESVYPAGRKCGEVAVTPLYDTSGVATRLIGIVHDITHRKWMEEEPAEAAKRKDKFLSLPGHEEAIKVTERLSRAVRRLLKAYEKEQQAIVQELHKYLDCLALLAICLVREEQKPPSAEVEQVDALFNDIQNLSHRLRSPTLEYLGLAATSARFCRDFSEQQKVQIDFASRATK